MIRKQSDEQMLAQLAFLFIQSENPSPWVCAPPARSLGLPTSISLMEIAPETSETCSHGDSG